MEGSNGSQGQRRIIIGLLFIAAGTLFALDRLGGFGLGDIGQWWPLLVVLYGISRVAVPYRAGDLGHGISWALVGLWLLAVQLHWYGLTYRNSWPLLFVSSGVGMVVRALTEDRVRRDRDAGSPS